MLSGGQRETAALVLDPEPRVILQQAPGSTVDAVSSAVLDYNPQTRVLVASPNLAVVCIIKVMDRAMQVSGRVHKIVGLPKDKSFSVARLREMNAPLSRPIEGNSNVIPPQPTTELTISEYEVEGHRFWGLPL